VSCLNNALGLLSDNGDIVGSLFCPRPGVSEEHLGENVEVGGVGTSIVSGDSNRHGIRILFVLSVLLHQRVRTFARYKID
jgi:hypothetical protein